MKARTREEFPVLVNHPPVIRKFVFVKRLADEICKGRECLSVIKILAEPDFNGSLLRTGWEQAPSPSVD